MKKILAILLTVLLLTAVMPAASLAASSNGKTTVYRVKTNGGYLHVRNSPNGKIITTLENGTPFTVSRTSGKWYKIKTIKTADTTRVVTGWVYKPYTCKNATGWVTTDHGGNLNIRKSPNGKVLGSIADGTRVTVKSISGNWVYVTSKRLSGWAFATYIGY